MKKTKTAVIYDKWLSQLGGGEVVACTTAKILKERSYRVIFICGKETSKQDIKRKLNIDLSGIEFKTIWNDTYKIKEISKNKDLFINFTFLDYTRGYAEKNLFYTHFPTKVNLSLIGKTVNTLLPILAKGFIPQEPIAGKVQISYNHVAYSLSQKVRLSYYYLSIGKIYTLEFAVYLANFSKTLLKRISWKIEGGKIAKSFFEIDHRNNLIKITALVIPSQSTIYFEVSKKKLRLGNIEDEAYLIYNPRLYSFFNISGYFDWFQQRLNNRFRAGLFRNALARINTYDLIMANSNFTKYWVKRYWRREAKVLYPPANLIFKRRKKLLPEKSNWVCSVGRFFTTGHGKKQEILIDAFKNFYDEGYKDWQLHLIGGAEQDEKTSKIIKKLKNRARGYPIFIHANISRKKMEDILVSSRLYWHATGHKENAKKNPILFEHFGIAVIEAISARCIPVLYSGGGLIEIIDKLNLDREKHLFKTVSDLVEKTKYLIENQYLINWNDVFKLLNYNFSYNAFKKNLISTLEDL